MNKNNIQELLKTKFKLNIKSMKLGEGLSNVGYELKDENSNKFFFKILSKNNPFKILEKHVHRITNSSEGVIFFDENYKLEKFIENIKIESENMTEDPYIIMRIQSLSNFSKEKFIISKTPSLFYIFKKDLNKKIKTDIKKKINSIKNFEKKKNFKTMFEKIEIIYNKIENKLKDEKMYLCHNDPNPTNFLFLKKEKFFKLIDFEYSGYNPLGMDILNMICEFMINYNCKNPPCEKIYFENYPKEKYLKRLIKFFLFFKEFKFKAVKNKLDIEEIEKLDFFKGICQDKINSIFLRFDFFGVLCNIFWFYWALYFHGTNDLEFDYLKFATCRFKLVEFFENKSNF